MLRSFVTAIIALAAVSTAQGQTTPARPAGTIQPGTYDLAITFGGGIMEGELQIASVRGDSVAMLLKVGGHDSPVRATQRRGNRLVLESTVPGMTIRYDLEFRADSVVGPFRYGDGEGSVAGRRRAGR